MEEKAYRVLNIIEDYENNDMTTTHIIEWVNQFDDGDREFILDELAVIFENTYLSKIKCKQLIEGYLSFWTNQFKYQNIQNFLLDTVFLDLQQPDKSQKELLVFLNDIITQNYGVSLDQCGQTPKHYIYLDDVLSTGTTVYRQLEFWLKQPNAFDSTKSNFEHIKTQKLNLHICLLCTHSWGMYNIKFRFLKTFGNDINNHIKYQWYYLIENNLKAYNPKLNHMIPVDNQPTEVNQYLTSLEYAVNNEDRAFRKATQPVEEKLFSSSASRTRIENIFLKKGIEILSRVQNLRVQQLRPLGYTIKSHKTFGLGTLFFTYRNIPNNCPIVFWWAGNNWKPLFVLKNRGRN